MSIAWKQRLAEYVAAKAAIQCGKRIIELVQSGERNPDILYEEALKGLRWQQRM
jgi:hypothetical protein